MKKHLAALATLAAAHSGGAAPAYIARVELPLPGATHAASGDLNGDGFADIAAVSNSAAQLYVYYGRGDGSFRFPPEIHATDANPAFVAIGDLTDDALTTLPDILVVTRQGTVPLAAAVAGDLTIFRNSGDPATSFLPRFGSNCTDIYLDGSSNGRNGNQPGFALLEDLNGDTKLDIIATSEFGNSVQSMFQGFSNPDLACSAPSVCNFGFSSGPGGCAPVATGSVSPAALVAGVFIPQINANTDVVALNAGANPARVSYHLHLNPNTDRFTTLPTQSFPIGDGTTTGLGAVMMVGAEITGDLVPDLLVADSLSDQISVLRGLDPSGSLSNPIFSTPSVEFAANDNPVWIGVGEFAAGTATNPARDAVVANRAIDRVSVLPAPSANATFLAPMCYPAADGPGTITVAEFNGDGADDLLVTNDRAGSISVFLSRLLPNAGFDTAYRRSTNPAGEAPVAIASGDLNNDGNLDLVAVHNIGGDAAVLLGDGAARFEEIWKRTATDPLPVALAIGRFDGDLNDDVVALSSNPGSARILLAVGDGTLRDAGALTVPDGARSIVAAPLNAGATVDLAVAVPSPASVRLLFGAGDGTFGTTADVPLSGSPTWLLHADLDAVAGRDLAVLDPVGATVQILRNNGSGVFTPGAAVATGGLDPNGFAAGNVDGNSTTDIVVTHNNGAIVVMLGDGNGGLTARPALPSPWVASAPIVGNFDVAAGNEVSLLLTDHNVLLVLPWDLTQQNLMPLLASSYGTGNQPRAAVAGKFDSSATLDSLVLADESDAPDNWTTTVLSGRRYDRFPHADAGPDRALCAGAPPVIIGTPGKSSLTYQWAPTTGLSSSTAAQPTVTSPTGGTWTVTVTSPSTGFSSTDSVTVAIASAPTPVILPNPAAYCQGGAPLVLDAGPGFARYAWSTGDTSQTISVTPSTPTTYTVDVTNSAGCAGQAMRDVTVGSAPVAVVTGVPASRCAGTPTTVFTADASQTVTPPASTLSFAWSFVGGVTGWSIATPTSATTTITANAGATPNPVTVRLVITATPGGCSVTADYTVQVLASSSTASVGNSLMAARTATGVDLSWTANGASLYSVYSILQKTDFPNILTAPFLLGTAVSPTPPYAHATTDGLRYYQVEGRCP